MQPKADTQIGLSQTVQQDTTSGTEVREHMQLFFNCQTVKCCVPQRSVLGPLLFVTVMMYRVQLIIALM